MKKSNLIIIVIVILLIFGVCFYFNKDNNDLQSKITKLELKNDSLFSNIKQNKDTIAILVSINNSLQSKINISKEQFTKINEKSKVYVNQYKKDVKYIQNMSDVDITKEFISTFSNSN